MSLLRGRFLGGRFAISLVTSMMARAMSMSYTMLPFFVRLPLVVAGGLKSTCERGKENEEADVDLNAPRRLCDAESDPVAGGPQ